MVSSERIKVTLTGGAPWGFRLSGGGGLPLTINKIRKKSVAHSKGLKEGDAVISINGVHVHDKSQDESLELVEKAGDNLDLEIFRGDMDEMSQDKPKKPIQIGGGSANNAAMSFTANVDDVSDAGASFVISSSVGEETSTNYETDMGGFKLTATVDDVSGSTFDVGRDPSPAGFTLTASVDEMTSSTNTQALESSPVILANVSDMTSSIHSSEVEAIHASSQKSPIMAEPFVDFQASGPSPNRLSPNPPRLSPKSPPVVPAPPRTSPKTPQQVSPKPVQTVSPQPIQRFSPQMPQPVITTISPKPVAPSITSNVQTKTFDDGQTRSVTTREQHVQKSDDGNSSSVVSRQTTTTTTVRKGPPLVQDKASAFNAVQPNNVTNNVRNQKSFKTTTNTSMKTSNQAIIKDQPKSSKPFLSSFSENFPPPDTNNHHMTIISSSRSTGNISGTPPVFKPSKFVPGKSKREIPGLYTPGSPMIEIDVNVYDGKENMAPPKPMFQVSNIVSDKAKRQSRDIWRPNLWLPGHKPPSVVSDETPIATQKDDFSPYQTFPVPKVKPGRSLVEEQKRKLFRTQSSRSEYSDFYNEDDYVDGDPQYQHHSRRLHVFAPPVEIHADDYSGGFSPFLPRIEHPELEDFEECPSSPDSSTIRRRKNLYSDSAFYDTPGKNYPTITEQMKLCKKIAQSLTSAANKRARGAKMFMRRKRKSNKWIHEGGHSEWSSSAGDIANIRELESEMSPDEDGKPLLYFKIPNLKNRVSKDAKQTKMALTQDQFEKLRLSSQKCDHRALPPDTCFDIVADLKAHKGRGGRMFERRRQRSDKFVLDEHNARHPSPQIRLESVLSQPVRQDKTPWEAAMENKGNVDAAFSHLSEWERNQKMNQILKASPPRKFHQPVVKAPVPVTHSSLKGDSLHLLRGRDFNRKAKGWSGGGEYPVAERVHHISPTRSSSRHQVTSGGSQNYQQNFNQVIKPFQSQGTSPYAGSSYEQWETQAHDAWQAPRHDGFQANGYHHSLDRSSTTKHSSTVRPKSWASDGIDGYVYKDEPEYTYAPVDFRHMEESYPTVAYMQPIIPGTDL